MYVCNAKNVNDAAVTTLTLINDDIFAATEDSRVGPVRAFKQPYGVTYNDPLSSLCLVLRHRKANPFLNFFEMLNSFRDDRSADFMVKFFGERFNGFANDGKFLGHYGARLRGTHDRMTWALRELRRNPGTRRLMLPIYDDAAFGMACSGEQINDIPCNTSIFPRIANGKLHLTVMNRSNDIWWGMFGVNYCYFTMVLRIMAADLELKIGTYTQISNNAHAYLEQGPHKRLSASGSEARYYAPDQPPAPLFTPGPSLPSPWTLFCADVDKFFAWVDAGGEIWKIPHYNTPFFRNTVTVMWDAWTNNRRIQNARAYCCPHWMLAADRYFDEKAGVV